MKNILQQLNIDYLLVNSTNEYLVEYSELSKNARYTLTGFSGSTGDALITSECTYLFVDGRYHAQADVETKDGIKIVKLQLGEKQDDKIREIINPNKILGIISKKVSQARLETFKGFNIKLLNDDPINNFTEAHSSNFTQAFKPKSYKAPETMFVTNLEEVSYITGLRDFSKDYSSKIWAKLLIRGNEQILLKENYEELISSIDEEVIVDKSSISAYDYSLIKNPVHRTSEIKKLKPVKSSDELTEYRKAFECTDKTLYAIRNYIETNDNLSEYDIATRLKEEFLNFGAKSLSFHSIVAINQNSAMAHYSKNSKEVFLKDGDLVLIDCGAYYETGFATDITRVFVKGEPSELQKNVYTQVLKAFLNAYNSAKKTGQELDTVAHSILDNSIENFVFSHGLGHGIGINVHEAPPALNQSEVAKTPLVNGMCYTIEPGLYNLKEFGIRLENSCYRENNQNISFTKMGFEGKLINFEQLSDKEKEWLRDFEIL